VTTVRSILTVLLCALLTVPLAAKPTQADLRLLIAIGAELQVGVTTQYDARYYQIPYPAGDVEMRTGVCADVVVRALRRIGVDLDVEMRTGVCADVVVRALRRIGVDLQVEVHEDMKRAFRKYPRIWHLSRPDANIDHRRVPNLMTYFERKGKALPRGSAYQPGDIVAWKLGSGLHHIGVVSIYRTPAGRALVIHNIGSGTRLDDVLGRYREIGHYRW
jgi:uncharacterized protein YijF (DUF1287 family)